MTGNDRMPPLALKGQKLLAQGNTLGKYGRKRSPCKGKSFVMFNELNLKEMIMMNEDLPYEQQMMPILKNYDKLVEENRELKSEIKALEKAVLSTRAMVKREFNVETSKLISEYENKERELIGKYENKEKKLITEYKNKKKTLITIYENRDKNRLKENQKLKDSVEKLEKKITTEKRFMRQELSDEAKFAMNTFKNREKKIAWIKTILEKYLVSIGVELPEFTTVTNVVNLVVENQPPINNNKK